MVDSGGKKNKVCVANILCPLNSNPSFHFHPFLPRLPDTEHPDLFLFAHLLSIQLF